uniref:BTB domain-containing protein n=2 Tax=Plectus sambesii TaxID=2011161 RepID=A0A914W8Y7_9BILA
MSGKFLRLNIGGTSYKLLEETARNRCKTSLISRLVSLSHEDRLLIADTYIANTEEYFFERSAHVFNGIYDFYIIGYLHMPQDVCSDRFLSELEFWQIPTSYLASCCTRKQMRINSIGSFDQTIASSDDEAFEAIHVLLVDDDPFAKVCCGNNRKKWTRFFEEPRSSILAQIYAITTIALIFTSVIGLVVGSLPELQDDGAPNAYIQYIEIVCIAWFTVEIVMRVLISPDKIRFLRQPLNLIDFLTILPFYCNLVLIMCGTDMDKMGHTHIVGVMMVVRLLRVLRVIRLFKLARYSKGLKLLGITLQNSVKELGFLVIFLAVGVIFFSTIIHILEKDEKDTTFDSIPAAAWWCVVTMTTIGYGDMVPTTFGGKVVASAASVCGIIVLAFPISMIVDNFARTHFKRRQKRIKRTAAATKKRSISNANGQHSPSRRSTSVTSVGPSLSDRLSVPRNGSAIGGVMNGKYPSFNSMMQLRVPSFV